MQVHIPLDDGVDLPAILELPEGPDAPPAAAVLILPSIFGSTAGTLGHARRLADEGHPVLVPTLFHRTDPGPATFDEAGLERGFARMRSYDRDRGLADLTAAAAFLRALPEVADRIVAHGICFGGHLAALLGQRRVVDAVHTVHGGGLERVAAQGPLPCPAVIHTGTADASIPEEAVQAVEAAWPDARVVRHEGAAHGFALPDSSAFDGAAYADATLTLIELLRA